MRGNRRNAYSEWGEAVSMGLKGRPSWMLDDSASMNTVLPNRSSVGYTMNTTGS
jgi:hypothetical protein